MEHDLSIPEREPARGHFGSPADLALDGLARQQRYLAGERRPPATHHLLGLAPTDVTSGRAVFSMPASPWVYGPLGTIQGGMIAVVADAPLSGAIMSELGPRQMVTTAEISVKFVRPATPDAGTIAAEATSIHVGANLGLSSCEVTDASGRLIAHATARNAILDAPEALLDRPDVQIPVDDAAQYDSPDPWERPPEGEHLPSETWDEMSGLEMAQAWCAGDLPTPPVGVLTGVRPVEAREGQAIWTAPSTRWWCSPAPFLYGGLLADFVETTLSGAFQTVVPAGQVAATLDLTVRFLRPVFPDSGDLRATAEVIHRGRSLLVGRAEIVGGDGRTAVLAEASAALVAPSALLRGQGPPVGGWDRDDGA